MTRKFLAAFLLCVVTALLLTQHSEIRPLTKDADGDDLIRWVDFDVSYAALRDAMELDIETCEQDLHIPWIPVLACLAAKYGGDFSAYQKRDLTALADTLADGASPDELGANDPAYDYYLQAYTAVLGGFLGLRSDGTYGLIAYSPLGAGFRYTDSDDFGNGRTYGFARKHLGHDLFCGVGTPVIAVEDGRVEALGWNPYGGWRIGIRSLDGSRYYYYAHLRRDTPYADGLAIGDRVRAGQRIGYSGQTGYSDRPNVNNIQVPHLHFGMQLIFDESQKECNAEIWIDTYALTRLLAEHRAGSDEQRANAADTSDRNGVTGADDAAGAAGITDEPNAPDASGRNGNTGAEGAAGKPNAADASGADDVTGEPGRTNAADEAKAGPDRRPAVVSSTEAVHTGGVEVPILMYHGLTAKASQVNDYFIPVETFAQDLAWLKANGYTAVTMHDLIAYVHDPTGRRRLPARPVVLTFDDGYYNNCRYASPLLKKYGMRAVVSVIGAACEENSRARYRSEDYGSVTWDELREMAASGLWEVQNHTYDLHHTDQGRMGARKTAAESTAAYRTLFREDLETLQSTLARILGVRPTTFAWPFGAYCDAGEAVLREMGFSASLGCRSGINVLYQGEPSCLYLMRRILRDPRTDIRTLLTP